MNLILLLSLAQFCYAQLDESFPTDQSDIATSLVKSNIVCCECVPFYLCENGTINTDGGGILDVRIGGEAPSTPPPTVNVDICPGQVDICCGVPDAPPSCSGETSPPSVDDILANFFFPDPSSECNCVVYSSCNPMDVVSNGLGKTSIELSNGRTVNHSKCEHSLDVCCLLSDDFIGNKTDNSSDTSLPVIVDQRNEKCECVPPFLCGPSGHIITDGSGALDVRIGPSKPPPPCEIDPTMVCCLPPKTDDAETSTAHEVLPTTPVPPHVEPPCGKRNFQGIGVRILGFQEGQTQFGEFPWVAVIVKEEVMAEKVVSLFQGGASLIHRRVAMTAAHKIKDIPAHSLKIRLGEWDASSEKENSPHQDVGVEKVIIHPGFNSRSLFHDVALLILKEAAWEEYNISPICPAASLDDVIPSSCVINGWGVDAFNSENYQTIMKSVRLPLVAKDTCQTLLRKTRLTKYFQLHNSFICAGGEEGVDACKGDGGGPLSCQRKDDPSRYLQVGITAWGVGCGGKDIPGVYVDVAVHYHWIMEQINSLFPDAISSHSEPNQTEDPLTKAEQRKLRKQERQAQRQKEREEKRRQRQEERRNNRQRNKNVN